MAKVKGAKVKNTDMEARIAELELRLAEEREKRTLAESELKAYNGSAENRMTALATLLVEALNDPDKEVHFNNPNMMHCPVDDEPRCWLHNPECIETPRIDDLGARMQACTDCNRFREIAPDGFTQVGELINAILHQLRRKQQQFIDAQQQLVQSEKLAGLGELAAGMAHEINNPTGIILSRLDCMELDNQNLPEDVKQDLSVIRRHADRLRRITKSLTSFARRNKVDKKLVVVQDLLFDLLEITERTLHRSNVEYTLELPEEPMTAYADATMIQQVFMNIILNARDAMPGGGKLDIRGISRAGELVFEIQDNGMGMDKETRARIFDPFFTTKDARGTGLGLSVSYGIIQDHGGRIEVESEPGQGAMFRVVIPGHCSMIDGVS